MVEPAVHTSKRTHLIDTKLFGKAEASQTTAGRQTWVVAAGRQIWVATASRSRKPEVVGVSGARRGRGSGSLEDCLRKVWRLPRDRVFSTSLLSSTRGNLQALSWRFPGEGDGSTYEGTKAEVVIEVSQTRGTEPLLVDSLKRVPTHFGLSVVGQQQGGLIQGGL